jgi:putative oxidoreductase
MGCTGIIGTYVFNGRYNEITQPIEELSKSMAWVNDFSIGMVRFIGASELLGGIGLLLPSLLRIRPFLTPLAALGLFIVMVLLLCIMYPKANTSYYLLIRF